MTGVLSGGITRCHSRNMASGGSFYRPRDREASPLFMESGPDMGIEPHPERMGGFYCGCKGDNWILCYTGVRQPIETMAKLPAGKRYSLTHIDPWEMTATKTDTVVTGGDDVRIPLSGTPYAAFLLEAAAR